MTEIVNERALDLYPKPVTIEGTNIILEQMKKCICKIENKIGNGTGFFCYIPYENKKLEVMITNNHIINEEIIKNEKILKVTLNDNKEKKIINIEKRKIYTSIKYDTTIIPIIPEEDKINNYLEIDKEIFDENINIFNKSIYLLQYPRILDEQKASVSYGIIKNIQDEYNIIHYCCTDYGSSGSPILRISNKKIIGIHKESISRYKYNIGTLLKYPINEYLNNINKNEINMTINIEKKDINNNIFFLDNTKGLYNNEKNNKVENSNDNLKELNERKVEIFIDNKKYKYKNKKYFNVNKEGIYKIKLKLNISIKDCSYMFANCSNIIDIDLSSFDTKDVINMSYMFYNCYKLTYIDLSSFETKNFINTSYMFHGCLNYPIVKLKNIIVSAKEIKIDLSNKNLSNMELNLISEIKFKNLEEINISHNNLSDIAPLKKFTKIKKIDLSFNKIKDITVFKEISKNNKEIEIINLSHNSIKNVDILKEENLFPCIIEINLDNNNISKKDIKEIKNIILEKNKIKKKMIIKNKINNNKSKNLIINDFMPINSIYMGMNKGMNKLNIGNPSYIMPNYDLSYENSLLGKVYSNNLISQENNNAKNTNKINVVFFIISSPLKINIYIEKEKTISDLIRAFTNKIKENYSDSNLDYNFYFIYNAKKINIHDESKIGLYFGYNINPQIMVNEVKYLIGAN